MVASQPHVLIVEDEVAQQHMLTYNCEAEGFRVSVAQNGEEALLVLAEDSPDVVILDWMMPIMSGIEVCRRIKTNPETKTVPVIMLSARSEDIDKVRGLDTGADDYIVKPYSVVELMARVRSQLRRSRPTSVGQTLTHSDITLDSSAHRVTRNGHEVKLGPLEFRLLSTFMEHPGRVWTRDQLLDRVWGRDVYHDSRTVDVHIGRLRKALTKAGNDDPIRTVRGTGYALS